MQVPAARSATRRATSHAIASLRRLAFRHYHDSKGRHIDPLRILYCGSDDFSVASLRRLQNEHLKDTDFIESIDVVCKPPRPYGRGLKKLYESPIRLFAESAKLPVHPISTFTRWQPPQPEGKSINLIIAVSFGLFVPPRLLTGAKYNGLNIHPSLLPSLRGPAPIQHTLLQGLTRSGISLCTLDPKKFDHGAVLRQEALNLPDQATTDYMSLVDYLAPRGAALLVEGLRQGAFMPPVEVLRSRIESSHAPKLTPQDAHIDLRSMSAEEILRRQKVLKPLWATWRTAAGEDLKVQFRDLEIAKRIDVDTVTEAPKPDSTHLRSGVPRIYNIKDATTWVDRTRGLECDGSESKIKPQRYSDKSELKGTITFPNGPTDSRMMEETKIGNKKVPAIGGMWTRDGAFMTFRGITLPTVQKSHHTEGAVSAIRRLYSLTGAVDQAFG